MDKNFVSKALMANLEQTKDHDIRIPEDQLWFASLSAEKWGIHKRTVQFLEELNHRMKNISDCIEMLHTICLSDLWFYNSLEASERALMTLVDIFKTLYDSAQTASMESHKDQWLKCLVKFLDRLVNLETYPNAVVSAGLELLEGLYLENEVLYIKNSRYFKTYLTKVAKNPEYEVRVTRFTKDVFLKCVDYWEGSLALLDWYDAKKDVIQVMTREKMVSVTTDFYQSLKREIMQSEDWQSVEKLMSYNDIANFYRNFTEAFVSWLETIYYLYHLLHKECMSHLSGHLLYDINRNMRHVFKELEDSKIQSFIDGMMHEFYLLDDKNASTVLDCKLTLGKEIIQYGDEKYLLYFLQKLIESGFYKPGHVQLNDNWQTQVNPNHVKNIRTWLELIGYNPSVSRQLISALIVNLKLGGIFIADTDVFQRDVTKLLNANIAPVYREIKQLAKLFPVYFRDIGAEGQLREASTAMDELFLRQDRLIHFLRKQIHTESNNTHIALTLSVLRYWDTLDINEIEAYIPDNVRAFLKEDSIYVQYGHMSIHQWLEAGNCTFNALIKMSTDQWDSLYEKLTKGVSEKDLQVHKRTLLLLKVYDLLNEKYGMHAEHVVGLLKVNPQIHSCDIEAFEKALSENNHKVSLDYLYQWMTGLKAVVLSEEVTEGYENIYYKRHVAVGIPSMYGQYVEPKFEALGLIYRLEVMGSKVMTAWLNTQELDFITVKTLERIHRLLCYFKDGLQLDGIYNEGFNSRLTMLQFSLTSQSFSLDQYINIFEFISRDIKQMIQEYFMDVYERPLKLILPQLGYEKDTDKQKVTEQFLRDHLYTAFLIQDLDAYVTKILSTLHDMGASYSRECLQNMMTYNPDLTLTQLSESSPLVDNTVFVGAKAFFLKRLKAIGIPVPDGFVLTTEVFRHKKCIWEHPSIRMELKNRIKHSLEKLHQSTGKRYGDAENPLLLSVRSGSSISLPGAMMTFLNVGMNDVIAQKFGEKTNNLWMAYDCYRRLLQSYGMAFGIARERFEALMQAKKQVLGVKLKSDFSGEEMKALALSYKKTLEEEGVFFEEDPSKQLEIIIKSVIDSWFSESAKTYRKYMEIAEEWGTAVLVQKMALGNQNEMSGTGVLFTNNPKDDLSEIALYGDFVLQSQGEDVVSGLVDTLPVSKNQEKTSRMSLETAFPEIYDALKRYSKKLIHEQGYVHQEIEFTFTSPLAKDLYILQTRNQKVKSTAMRRRFAISETELTRLCKGIGAGNGLLNGYIAFDEAGIEAIKQDDESRPVILLRIYTVPDDIPLIFKSEALITTKGGVTSHAAVTAAGLGKTCIVEAKGIVIDEQGRFCRVKGHILKTGDAIAIDGHLGNIYLGHHQIEDI